MTRASFGSKTDWKIFLFTRMAAWLVRLWFGTVRVKIVNRDIFDNYFRNDRETGNVVAGAWHRNAIFFFYYFRRLKNAAIMVSRSKDGDYAAGVGKSFGYDAVRGSSTRGGAEALSGMIAYMRSHTPAICGTAVDGPRGPARQLKKGMLVLASQTDAYFIPMACSGTRVITFTKAWDKTILPKPFSKMILTFGTPVKIPPDISEEDLETVRADIEKELNAITDQADRLSGYDRKFPLTAKEPAQPQI